MDLTLQAFDNFYSIVKKLRSPEGCPWDKKQTPESLRTPLVEEAFEAVDAINEENSAHVKEELGDVFLNTLIIAQIYEETGDFSVADMFQDVSDKLVRRHPHVFPQSEGKGIYSGAVTDATQVLEQWDAIKEKVEGRKTFSVLDQIPQGFPPLLKAYKLQKKAAKKGFDWENPQDVIPKIDEELLEASEAYTEKLKLQAALKDGEEKEVFVKDSPEALNSAHRHLEEEIGDVLFSVVNLSRVYKVDPVLALAKTNEKFYRRFTFVERSMEEAGIPMDKEHLSNMDELWEKAKTFEKNR